MVQQAHERVRALLYNPEIFGDGTEEVEIIETHGAVLFLGSHVVYKIKKPVSFNYIDFSTLEKRQTACKREIELNQPACPEIYLGITRITAEADGTLKLNGSGQLIDVAVRMKRFPEGRVLKRVAERGEFTPELARALGEQLAHYHQTLQPILDADKVRPFGTIIDDQTDVFKNSKELPASVFNSFGEMISSWHETLEDTIKTRLANGYVRRCHGDLHLGNIVLIDDVPKPFDALEFNEEMATHDVIYDLAFVLMDMIHAGLLQGANTTFNAYASNAWELLADDGLKVLPFYLAVRAAIRAMVSLQTISSNADTVDLLANEARLYLSEAQHFLKPHRPRLVAVGGFSGTGKSTLAANLASTIGAAPGALVLRSDVERKKLFKVGELDPLPREAYSLKRSKEVYGVMLRKADACLRQGHSVVLDAVHARKEEQTAAVDLAKENNLPFQGFWLSAPQPILANRVNNRRDDASDATVGVLAEQLERHPNVTEQLSRGWQCIDASGTAADTKNAVTRSLHKH